MANPFYLRKYKISVQMYSGQSINLSNLRCTFKFDKRIDRSYQFGEVTIYNLDASTETNIFQNGQAITIEAGYQTGKYGMVFTGLIRQPIRGKENATDYFLKLVCIDGDDALNLGFCNFTLSNGQTTQSIAKQVARNSTVPFDVKIDAQGQQQATIRGKSFFGQPQDYLRSIALNNNAAFYFNNGQANISNLSKSPPSVVPLLNAQTGLIGMPQQVESGVKFRCLIDPSLVVDGWVKLNNQDIILAELQLGQLQTMLDMDGVYRIIGISALADTRGNDWYYDIETVSQAGYLPTMLAGQTDLGM